MIPLPSKIASHLEDADWTPVTIGHSGAQTFWLRLPYDRKAMYLKVMERETGRGLEPEFARLIWVQDKLSVPEIVDFATEGDCDYLLTAELSGVHAANTCWSGQLPAVVRELAYALRRVHAVPIASCLFDKRLHIRMEEARRNMDLGLVDEGDFDPKRLGRDAESLYQELLLTRPKYEDPVFTHGDYCLPNIVLKAGGQLSGFIDWGSAGVADRYQDLALAYRSITFNFGAEWADRFLYEYGLERPDWAKMEFYQLLDEFF